VKEFSLWILAAFVVFYFVRKIIDKETVDQIGQAVLALTLVACYVIAVFGRIFWIFISAWLT